MVIFWDIETCTLEPFARHARVTMVGFWKQGQEPIIIYNDDEKLLLEEVWSYVLGNLKERFVGWNCIGFDVKYLIKRSIVKGVVPNTQFISKQLDLRNVIDSSPYAKGKLTEVCQAINGEHKLNHWPSSEAPILFWQNRLKELEDYLVQDLRLTKMLWEQLKKVGLIQ